MELRSILISRTDSIGDVVLTLPMAYILKQNYPNAVIGFLGNKYTQPVIDTCTFVDVFIDIERFLADDNIDILGRSIDCIIHVLPKSVIAKRAKELRIPLRIGTTNRLYHWYTCNKLVRLSRKNSALHEAQLNLKLLEPLIGKQDFPIQTIPPFYGLTNIAALDIKYDALLDKKRKNVILHPKSQGNGQEWPLENYIELIKMIDAEKFKIFISGTEREGLLLKPLFEQVSHLVTDITGQMTLSQFIAFIKRSDILVASGTGPLHISAALGIQAIGIFPPLKPIHPGRWQPIGLHAEVVCYPLQKQKLSAEDYINKVRPEDVLHLMMA